MGHLHSSSDALRRRNSESGAAAVEFALVVPILLVIVFGVITFGMVFASQLSMNSAARDAARAGVVQNLNAAGLTCSQIAAQARAQVDPLGGKSTDVAITVTGPDGSTACSIAKNTASVTGSGSTAMCTNSSGLTGQLVVKLTYTANSPLNLIPAASSIPLSAAGSFTCEYS